MRGPIDFIAVSFEGNNFDGSILNALGDAIEKGVIGLVALSVIIKDEDGSVQVLGVQDLGNDVAAEFVEKYSADSDAVDQDDIDEIADILEPNSAAGLLIIEQLWAKPLKEALQNANGKLIAEGRIHPEAAQELDQKEDE